MANGILNKCSTYSTCTTIGISIAEKNSSLNFPFSKSFQVKALFCCSISQYINLLSSSYKNPDSLFLSILSFLLSEYHFFSTNLGSHSSNFSISSKEFSYIFIRILNLLGSVLRTGFILRATSLYFLVI